MHFLFIIIFLIPISVVVGLWGVSENRKWGWVSLVAALLLSIWVFLAIQAPGITQDIYYLKPSSIESSLGVRKQYITFQDTEGFIKTVDLTERFGGSVPDDSKVKVTVYKKYYYYGVSFSETVLKPERIECVAGSRSLN